MEKHAETSQRTTPPLSVLPLIPEPVGRRMFLRFAGVTAATGFVLGSCTSQDVVPGREADDYTLAGARVGDVIDLGAGDIGILNYAYTLEQIEGRFLEMVVDMPYNGMSAFERQVFIDLRNQEKSHRVFFESILGNAKIPPLTFNFSSVDFRSRQSVLETARFFADTATGAYNGAGRYLANAVNLATAGKLVSVEARHAAIIREIIAPGSSAFAGDDVVDPMGLDLAFEPIVVLPKAQKFVLETITANNLPKS